MLKKVGMIAAAATLGLLAVSPLAFANDEPVSDSTQLNSVDGERNQLGLVNTNDNNTNTPAQACGNAAVNTATDAVATNPVTGILGSGLLTSEAGDATSAAECEQGGTAGTEVSQSNER